MPTRPPDAADAARLGTTRHESETLMAVPKRKMSRANTRSRRAQWKASPPDLVPLTVNGRTVVVPRRLVRAARLGLVEGAPLDR